MKAYIILHGQTDFDAEGRIIGNNDPQLNDAGREQARNAATELVSKGIDMILASPQKRTMETAEIISGILNIDEIRITKGLKLYERTFGDLEGKLISEVDMFALSSWFGNAAVPNGETVKDTANRVIAYMNNMVKIFRTKTMLLVVPEHVFRVLYWFFTGLPEFGKEPVIDATNCKIYEFDTDDIPTEIKDYQPAVNLPGDTEGDDPSRLLSQDEINKLILELMGE
ncbi:MAG: histidine phosphatase family protein [Oscillospiraceae bacterium]|jgi:probable phosphoglycerate mutase|nr:histidine phosphatase family protein [Oscillospiraceae bacterium]